MALTLEQLSARLSHCPMTCVAGFRGLQRPVTSFSVVDTPQILSWLHGGELVVSAGYITKTHPDLRKTLIEELYHKGCAGFAVKLHRYYDQPPAEWLEQGDRLGFPVFTLPYEVRFCDLAYELHKCLFAQELQENEQLYTVYAKLVAAVLPHRDTQRCLYELAAALGGPVLLADRQWTLVAAEAGPGAPPTVSLTPGQSFLPPETCRRIEALFPEGRTAPALAESAAGVWAAAPLRDGPLLHGYLLLPQSPGSDARRALAWLEAAAPLLTLLFTGASAAPTRGDEAQRAFVQKVLLTPGTPVPTIQSLCAANGFREERYRVCLSLRPDGAVQRSFAKRKSLRELVDSFCHRTELEARLQCLPFFLHEGIALFLIAGADARPRTLLWNAEQTARGLQQTLQESGLPVTLGLSGCQRGADTIALSFSQSLQSLRLGRRLDPDGGFYLYRDYQLYDLLCRTMDADGLRALCDETVAPLEDHDRREGTHYLETLTVYLRSRFNVTHTAAAMHVHRNTMMYQLDAIRDLLPLDLDNPEDRLKLQMGLSALQLRRHPG